MLVFIAEIDDEICYNTWNETSWQSWQKIPGFSSETLSTSYTLEKIHIVIKDLGQGIWYGYISLSNGNFIGWTSIPGLTNARPIAIHYCS